jgi:foldase protein PrsA
MKKLITTFALMSFVILSACNNGADTDKHVIAEVEGVTITESQLIAELKDRYSDAVVKALVEEIVYDVYAQSLDITEGDITNELNDLRAANNLADDVKFSEYLAVQNIGTENNFRNLIKQHLIVQLKAADIPVVTDTEIQEQYDAGKEVEASHILVGDIETAQKVLNSLEEGQEFSVLAQEYSSDGSSAGGGSLGYFGRGQMVPEFEKAAFSLDVGEVSEPIQSQFGYHIIKVTDRKPFEESFEKVKDELEAAISKSKVRSLDEVHRGIIENATIDIKDKQYKHLFITK